MAAPRHPLRCLGPDQQEERRGARRAVRARGQGRPEGACQEGACQEGDQEVLVGRWWCGHGCDPGDHRGRSGPHHPHRRRARPVGHVDQRRADADRRPRLRRGRHHGRGPRPGPAGLRGPGGGLCSGPPARRLHPGRGLRR